MLGQTGITFSGTLWIKLHFSTTIFVLGMWYKRLYVNVWKNITKRITYSPESLKLEWGYGKWWCNMGWCVCCGMECGTLRDVKRGRVWAVAWNVERCAMWNEEECGLWHGAKYVLVEVVLYARCFKWWVVECGGVLTCDVDVMWNMVVRCGIRCDQSDVVEWCKMWNVVQCCVVRDVVVRCINVWLIHGAIWNWCGVEYMECGTSVMGCNARCQWCDA